MLNKLPSQHVLIAEMVQICFFLQITKISEKYLKNESD